MSTNLEYPQDPNNPLPKLPVSKNPPGVEEYMLPSTPYAVRKNAMFESFSWMEGIDSFKTTDTGKNSIKIKGVCAKANEVSKNGRVYLDEELAKAASSMINKKVSINHDNERVVGNIVWAEYENGALEYLAQINKQPYVTMIREGSASLRGVSLQANYLFLKCSKCFKKFQSQEAWAKHMETEEFMKDGLTTPHGIVFDECALSLVMAPEVAGLDTTIEIAESVSGFNRLCETALKERGFSLQTSKGNARIAKEGGVVGVVPIITKDDAPVQSEEEQIKDETTFLENHSDPKVAEAFKHLLSVMD